MPGSFHELIEQLDAAGELRRVTEPVSPILEITEIAHRHARRTAASGSPHAMEFDPAHANLGGDALLFENVEGCDFPVAINLFGSYRRMEIALGCEAGGFQSIAERIASLTKPEPPKSMRDAIARAKEFLPLLRIAPRKTRGTAPCQQVVKRVSDGDVDLTRIPILKCWPLDGDPAAVGYGMTAEEAGTAGGDGRYITLAGMHTIHARDRGARKPSSHNIGMYRSQLLAPTELAMHWHVHHDGAAHWRSWKAIGEPMPIAICLGGNSVMPYAATAPLPPGISELLMAGFLAGRGIRMTDAVTVPLRIPADSEIVIEGFVDTDCGPIGYDPRTDGDIGPGAVFEGPFGDHTGFYSLPDRYPRLRVTAVTHRRHAIYPATIVGLPPQEDYYLGKATERIFFPLLKTLIHDIQDYHLPTFGCFHNCAFIRIDKAYPLQARRVMHAVWGAGQMAWTKMIVVVDGDVDVHDEAAVLRAIATSCHLRRDIERVRGPLDILDHAAPFLGGGTKIGFDATTWWPGEDAAGVGDDAIVLPTAPAIADAQARVSELNGISGVHVPDVGQGRFVVVAVSRDGAVDFDSIVDELPPGADMIIAVNTSVDITQWQEVFFHLCANGDPGRDARMIGDRICFDARSKHPSWESASGEPIRDYPPILEMAADVVARVNARAERFGL